ncbi:MAG: NAD(P)H-hydrate dehydratase, partial [Chthoniobacterales bacterium]
RSDAIVTSAGSLGGILPRRKFSAYKNQFGRVGIVAGSRGLTGAAVLCASGALRGGAGLVNLFVTQDVYPIIASIAPPEAMVRGIASYADLNDQPVNVWAIGPGLGKEHAGEIRDVIRGLEQPVVVDADGLNAVADDPQTLLHARGPRLLTPHPGEMKRLWPSAPEDRASLARTFTGKMTVTLLLKGSRTIVAKHSRPLSYNTAGTPAMATGGMGDVLTGVCAALIAQHLSLYDAARLGAWACARAAEIAIARGTASEESLIASDVIHNLGRAFNELR